MAAFQKFYCVAEDKWAGVHDLTTGTSHVLKVLLTNSAPSASHATKSDLTEIAAGNGYTAGGATVTLTSGAQTAGTFKLVLDDVTITAASGSIGPFRYAVLYNDTPTSPADPLLGWWDYGTALTLADGQQFVVDFSAVNGVLTDA